MSVLQQLYQRLLRARLLVLSQVMLIKGVRHKTAPEQDAVLDQRCQEEASRSRYMSSVSK